MAWPGVLEQTSLDFSHYIPAWGLLGYGPQYMSIVPTMFQYLNLSN